MSMECGLSGSVDPTARLCPSSSSNNPSAPPKSSAEPKTDPPAALPLDLLGLLGRPSRDARSSRWALNSFWRASSSWRHGAGDGF